METKRTLKDKILLIIKGLAMGTANKVPGVSGGIVAFAAGFYEEFIYSLQKMNRKAFGLLFKRGWKSFAQYTNFQFLGLLVLGMILSFFTISQLLDYLIEKKELYVWALFFGMIIGSIYYIAIDFKQWNIKNILGMIIGAGIGISISFLEPAKENDNLLFIFLCGFISVSGMTLPGLSGSFILILIGNYTLLLVDSVNALYDAIINIFQGNFDFFNNNSNTNLLKILAVFASGSAIGLVGLSTLLSYLMKHFKNLTMAVIIGFITGSLGVVWPWKKTIYLQNSLGEIEISSNGKKVIANYERFVPSINDIDTWIAFFWIIVGIVIVLLLEYYGRKSKQKATLRSAG